MNRYQVFVINGDGSGSFYLCPLLSTASDILSKEENDGNRVFLYEQDGNDWVLRYSTIGLEYRGDDCDVG